MTLSLLVSELCHKHIMSGTFWGVPLSVRRCSCLVCFSQQQPTFSFPQGIRTQKKKDMKLGVICSVHFFFFGYLSFFPRRTSHKRIPFMPAYFSQYCALASSYTFNFDALLKALTKNSYILIRPDIFHRL